MNATRAAALTVVMLVAVAGHELSDAKAMVAGQVATQGAGDATRDHRVVASARYDVVKPDYRGSFGGDSKALIAIRTKQGRPVKGLFQAKNFELLCDDGSRSRRTLTIPIRIRFTSAKDFTGQFYRAEPRNWTQSYTRVEGHLMAESRRARGYMLRIEDPADPPGTQNEPECGTFGRSHWRAERVRR